VGDAVRIEVDHLTDRMARPLVLTDTDWLSYSINSDMMALADTFEIQLRPSKDLLKWFRLPGHTVRVYLDGHLRLRGMIESVPISTEAEGLTLSAAGRDYGLFLVDNAAPAVTFDATTMAQIVTALLQPVKEYITKVETDPVANRHRVAGVTAVKAAAAGYRLGVDEAGNLNIAKVAAVKGIRGVKASVYRGITTERSYETRTKAGDKIGNRIEWLAEQIGCRVWMGAQGELIIGRPDYAQAPMYQPLYVHLDDYGNVTGSNCLIRHSGDIGDRHAKIAIVAQGTDAASALGNSVSEFFESVADPSESFFDVDPAVLVKRVPKTDVMTTQGAVDQKAVTRAARSRLEERAVKSAELTFTLDGHRQSESVPLWACDTVVNVDFQPRDVNAPYYIWRCALRGDEHGRTTEIAAIPCGIWMAVDHDTMSPQAYLQHLLPLWKRYAL